MRYWQVAEVTFIGLHLSLHTIYMYYITVLNGEMYAYILLRVAEEQQFVQALPILSLSSLALQ